MKILIKPATVPGETSPESAEEEENTTETSNAGNADVSTVYMTKEISPAGLLQVYEALQRIPAGNVAVKLSTGEADGHYYLSPDLIGDLLQSVNGTIIECNTAYGGSRSSTASHMQVAEDHGFTAIAEVDIMDADGSMSIPVADGAHLDENLVGADLADYDFVMVLSHFKGHAMAGYGGAIKNISIGIASSEGKAYIHSGGTSTSSMWGGDQDAFLESMGEAAKAVSDYEGNGERILYISVMNNLSVDCDCDSNPSEPDMHDVGILASLDPVALDQACIDIVYDSDEGGTLVDRIEGQNGLHTLEYAEQIGLGNRGYNLVSVDG